MRLSGREYAASVVILQDGQCSRLLTLAAETIPKTVRRWTGVDLPVSWQKTPSAVFPGGPSIVLTTLESLRRSGLSLGEDRQAVERLHSLDEQGFILVPQSGKPARLLVVSSSERGVYNGARYLRDFLIEGDSEDLRLRGQTTVREPRMLGRPVYLLTIWGNEDEYAPEDYQKVFESFVRDGIDRIYFWASGHFPSRKFPQSYKVDNGGYDSTEDSRLGTVEDLRKVIHSAHDLGLKIYLGGALGSWAGTRFLTHLRADTMKQGVQQAEGQDFNRGTWSLCPSHPESRQALISYYQEMFDALPEADGLFIESADELGKCACERCRVPVDDAGSRMFGQYQLNLVEEIMDRIWTDHPRTRLAYTIGYTPHQEDPAYYERIRQMKDPRFEWMEARNSWEFPAPGGKRLPAPHFSDRVMIWKYHDRKPLDQMISDIQRAGREGWYGCISSFSPGFFAGAFYSKIPLPTDLLPYNLNHFVHRELTWNPALTNQEVRSRIQQRFFGLSTPPHLGDDLVALREILRISSRRAWGVPSKGGRWQYLGEISLSGENSVQLDQIEKRSLQARKGAQPKTLEGINLMLRAIRDLRSRL